MTNTTGMAFGGHFSDIRITSVTPTPAYVRLRLLRDGETVARTQQVHPGVMLDFDADGALIGVEILGEMPA